MAKKSFMKVNGLSDEIVHRAKKALNNEVKDYVVDRLKKSIQKEVYNTYSPVEYERRESDNGLMDDSDVNGHSPIRANVHSRTLTVYEEAKVDPPKLKHKDYHVPDGLARLIEDGAHNPWNERRYRWTKPRPFVSDTQNYINEHPNQIKKMIQNRIEHDDNKK